MKGRLIGAVVGAAAGCYVAKKRGIVAGLVTYEVVKRTTRNLIK